MSDQFCLRWNNYQLSLTSAFKVLRDDEDFVDCTLSTDGRNIKAHKFVLSACSPYFKELLKGISQWQHPVVFLRDVSYQDLEKLLEFVYVGEVNVSQDNLQSFLKAAEALEIKGLTDDSESKSELPPHPSSLVDRRHESAENLKKVDNPAKRGFSPKEKNSPKRPRTADLAEPFSAPAKDSANLYLKEEPLENPSNHADEHSKQLALISGRYLNNQVEEETDKAKYDGYNGDGNGDDRISSDEFHNSTSMDGLYGQMFQTDSGGLSSNSSELVECNVCKKQFASKSSMQRHQKEVHDRSTSVQCEVCHVVVGSRDRYLRHKREKHEDVQEYLCVDCNKVYHSKNSYVSHRSRYHRGLAGAYTDS